MRVLGQEYVKRRSPGMLDPLALEQSEVEDGKRGRQLRDPARCEHLAIYRRVGTLADARQRVPAGTVKCDVEGRQVLALLVCGKPLRPRVDVEPVVVSIDQIAVVEEREGQRITRLQPVAHLHPQVVVMLRLERGGRRASSPAYRID